MRAQDVIERVSVGSGGTQSNGDSNSWGSTSYKGRFVAFHSDATNLVPGDTNGLEDVFVRDRRAGTTERVSVGPGGVEGNGFSGGLAISADGRFVAFSSNATNLVPGSHYGYTNVFVRDRRTGAIELVSSGLDGFDGDSGSNVEAISADGRFVVFFSDATNLVPGDTNATWDVFVRDRRSSATRRVSVRTGGGQANGSSVDAAISTNGRFVVFYSSATNLVPNDTNGVPDVFLRDRWSNTTRRVSVGAGGVQSSQESRYPAISGDGRFVAFASNAPNLVPGDTNNRTDVFVRDRQTNTTRRVSVGAGGVQGNGSSDDPDISLDGRFVAFHSVATNLVRGDTNGLVDAFVHDRQTGSTRRVSVGMGGVQGNGLSGGALLSPDGRVVTFNSSATNLVRGDTNGSRDVFLRVLAP